MRVRSKIKDKQKALELLHKLELLQSFNDINNMFLDFSCKAKRKLFSGKKVFHFKIFYRYQSKALTAVIFLKKKLLELPHADNFYMKHLLIGLLISYKKLLSKVAFHGFISHNCVIGSEQSSGIQFPPQLGRGFSEASEADRLPEDFITYKYQLTYHHLNMVSIREWLGFKRRALFAESK